MVYDYNPVTKTKTPVGIMHSRGDFMVKSITWTGTGTLSHDITFPTKPTLLLAIQGFSNDGYLQAVPVEYGASRWNYAYMPTSSFVSGGSVGSTGLSYSADELTMTISHSDSDGAGAYNTLGQEYTLYYI